MIPTGTGLGGGLELHGWLLHYLIYVRRCWLDGHVFHVVILNMLSLHSHPIAKPELPRALHGLGQSPQAPTLVKDQVHNTILLFRQCQLSV